MSTKINPIRVILAHVATLKNESSKTLSPWDIGFFLVYPFFISMYFVATLSPILNDSMLSLLTNIMAIFSALLLNLLMLVISEYKNTQNAKIKKICKQLNHNISFSVLICLINLCILFAYGFTPNESKITYFKKLTIIKNLNIETYYYVLLKDLFLVFIFYILFVFILNCFMILKRSHSVIYNLIK